MLTGLTLLLNRASDRCVTCLYNKSAALFCGTFKSSSIKLYFEEIIMLVSMREKLLNYLEIAVNFIISGC